MRQVWLAAVLWSVTALALAQAPVVNPRTVEFAPSADHDLVLPADLGGGPAVVSYEARYETVAGAAVCAVNFGKPTPTGPVLSLPLPVACVPVSWTTRYVVRVVALGPTGEGVSAASNPFASVSGPQPAGIPTVRR